MSNPTNLIRPAVFCTSNQANPTEPPNPTNTINQIDDNVGQFDKIPDIVKCIREFSVRRDDFASWKKSVDRILYQYESVRGSQKYFAILNVIRNKIIGEADIGLESYSTPLDWNEISKCLTSHYADRRHIGTLEFQMASMMQGNLPVQQFYQKVYYHLSLILNKISCMEVGEEGSKRMPIGTKLSIRL